MDGGGFGGGGEADGRPLSTTSNALFESRIMFDISSVSRIDYIFT